MRKDTSKTQTFYGHLRNDVRTPTASGGSRIEVSNQGGLTVAWRADVPNNVLVYSVAICSDKDNFNKKIGRTIAEGRLKANKAHIMTDLKLSDMTPGEVTTAVLNHADRNPNLP